MTVLLVVQLCLIFFAAPLAAKGLPIARQTGEVLVLVLVVIVVMLSRNRGAIALILLGMAATLASFSFEQELSPVTASVLRRGGDIVSFSTLSWVVALAAPGRITEGGCVARRPRHGHAPHFRRFRMAPGANSVSFFLLHPWRRKECR